MSEENKSWSILDVIAVVSFLIGIANYNENVDQSTMDNTVRKAVSEIHYHLIEQDEKMDKILAILGVRDEDHRTSK